MKILFLVLFIVFSFSSGSVFAAPVSFSVEGEVIQVEPKYRALTTYGRECWTEEVPAQPSSSRSYGGAVLGGVTGGVVGNQIGKGKGKEVATAIGAAVGAIVGDNIDNDGYREPSIHYRSEQRCRSVPRTQDIADGYDVTVRFQGRDIVFRMRDNPGYGLIRLNFSGTVTPINQWRR